MNELPKRRPRVIKELKLKKDYTYSELLNNNLQPDEINAIIFSVDDLSGDMSKLIGLLEKSSDIQLKFKDFESVLFVDEILKKRIDNKTFLLDDGTRKDRSYIDLSKLKKLSLTIPLNYLMWGVGFKGSIDTYCFLMYNRQSNYANPTSINGNERLLYEDYKKIKKKLEELLRFNPTNSVEKIALVSDYIQSCTQFIEGYESESSIGTFITPDFPPFMEYREKSGLLETVLNDNNGVCMGIANLSTVLLNNSEMDMEVESVYGNSHVWNKVLVDGKYYYFDNTWSITRSENVSEEGLITLAFTKKYLLFGQNTAMSIGHHNPESIFVYDGIVSEEDMHSLAYNSQFEYNKRPKYRSIRK